MSRLFSVIFKPKDEMAAWFNVPDEIEDENIRPYLEQQLYQMSDEQIIETFKLMLEDGITIIAENEGR